MWDLRIYATLTPNYAESCAQKAQIEKGLTQNNRKPSTDQPTGIGLKEKNLWKCTTFKWEIT